MANTFNKLLDGTGNTTVGNTITEISEYVITVLEADTVLLGNVEKSVALKGANGKSWEVLSNTPTVQIRSGLNPVAAYTPVMDKVDIVASLPMVIKYPIYDEEARNWKVDKSDTFQSVVIEQMLCYLSALAADCALLAGTTYTCTGTNGMITLDDVDNIHTEFSESKVSLGRIMLLGPRPGNHLRKSMRAQGGLGMVVPEIANPLYRDAFLGRYSGFDILEDQNMKVTRTGEVGDYTYSCDNIAMKPGAIKMVSADLTTGIVTPGIVKNEYLNPETGVSFKISTSSIPDPVGTMYMFELTVGMGCPDPRLLKRVVSAWK